MSNWGRYIMTLQSQHWFLFVIINSPSWSEDCGGWSHHFPSSSAETINRENFPLAHSQTREERQENKQWKVTREGEVSLITIWLKLFSTSKKATKLHSLFRIRVLVRPASNNSQKNWSDRIFIYCCIHLNKKGWMWP